LGPTNYDSKNIITDPKYCGLGKRYLNNMSYGERRDVST
jgi:hypothetical protein